MTIAFGSIGARPSGNTGNTTSLPLAYPASIGVGDGLICGRCVYVSSAGLALNQGGWIKSGDLHGGTGTVGDQHTTRARADFKVADGIENNTPNTITFSQSGTLNGAIGVIARYTKDPTKVWDTAGGLTIPNGTGTDNAHGADRSITTGAMNIKAGDVLNIVVAVDTDLALTITAPTISATGFTFGTVTRRTPATAGVITGNDGNVEMFDVEVLTGTEASVAVTFAFTTVTTQCGPVVITRLREVAPTYPSLLPGVEPETHSRNAVIPYGENLYRVTESYLSNPTDWQNQPQVLKSIDAGLTWVEKDAANRPGVSGSNIMDMESAAFVKDGTLLKGINQGSDRISYMEFQTSTDTWVTTVREDSATTQAPSPAPQYVSITCPTGQAYDWLFWQATGGRYRSRTNSTTFGTITNIDGTAALFPTAVLDSSDVSWIFYKKAGTPNQLHYKKLTGGGTLDGSSTRVDTNGVSAHADHVVPYAPPVFYESGADDVESIVFVNTSQQLRCVDVVNGVPGAEQTVSTDTLAGDEGSTTSLQTLVALAVDGTTLHAVWVDSPNWDIRTASRPYGGAWSSTTTLYATGTTEIAYITAAVVEHSGTKYLGFTYDLGPHGDDDSNILYNRVALSAPAITGTGTAIQAGQTADASGTVAGGAITGTVTATQANQTADASGTLGYSGTIARNQVSQTSTATGILSYTGTVARTQVSQTAAATGVLGYAGTVAAIQAAQGSAAAGVLGYSGTVSATQAAQTATASGLSGSGILGSVAATQVSQTATAAGILGYAGAATPTQVSQTSAATGVLGYSGTVAAIQAANTAAASGVFATGITGTVAATQAAQMSTATGVLGYTGTVARSQTAQTSAASGAVTGPVVGSVAVTQASQTATAAGVVTLPITGTVAATQANQIGSAAGVLGYTGAAAASQASQSASTSGVFVGAITGTVTVTQVSQTAAASGMGPFNPDPYPTSHGWVEPASHGVYRDSSAPVYTEEAA